MRIRSKLSGVVWTLVVVTLTVSLLFLWGGVRCQYFLQRAQLAHEHHHSLLMLSRRVDEFFSVVYESFIRPQPGHEDEICAASERVQESLYALAVCSDAEVAFVEEDEKAEELDERAELHALSADWNELEAQLFSEVTMALAQSGACGPEDWQRLLGSTLHFSSRIDGAIIKEQSEAQQSARRMQALFQDLSLTGIVIWSLCSLLVGVAGFLFGRSIVSPIHRLLHASRALGDGQLEPVETRGNDELSDLANAFNKMAAQVESQQLVLLCAKGAVEAKNAALETEVEARRQAVKALEQAKDAAETANRAKSEFLARMSHEIRTPMNGITGMADVLLDGELADELSECAQTIRTSSQALLAIVNDVLDFSKIEAGEMQIENLRFDLRKLMEDVVRLLAPRAKEKNLNVTLSYDEEAPTRFLGDPGRIRQVLVNLLGNAIKFTHEGGVALKAQCEDTYAGGAQMSVKVEDSGVGVRSEDARKIPRESSTRMVTLCGATPAALSRFRSRSARARAVKATASRCSRGSSKLASTVRSGGMSLGSMWRSSPLARRWASIPGLPNLDARVSRGSLAKSPNVPIPSQRNVSIISSPFMLSLRVDRSRLDRNPIVSTTTFGVPTSAVAAAHLEANGPSATPTWASPPARPPKALSSSLATLTARASSPP